MNVCLHVDSLRRTAESPMEFGLSRVARRYNNALLRPMPVRSLVMLLRLKSLSPKKNITSNTHIVFFATPYRIASRGFRQLPITSTNDNSRRDSLIFNTSVKRKRLNGERSVRSPKHQKGIIRRSREGGRGGAERPHRRSHHKWSPPAKDRDEFRRFYNQRGPEKRERPAGAVHTPPSPHKHRRQQ